MFLSLPAAFCGSALHHNEELRSASGCAVWSVWLACLARLALMARRLTPPPELQWCECVCVTGSVRSGRARRRSRLSSSDTFTRRQGPTCACLFHEVSDFTRRLICAHTLSACRNLFTLHLSSPGHLAPVPPSAASSHLPSAGLDSITVLCAPAGNPPAQPVLGAPSQSTVITIIQ